MIHLGNNNVTFDRELLIELKSAIKLQYLQYYLHPVYITVYTCIDSTNVTLYACLNRYVLSSVKVRLE